MNRHPDSEKFMTAENSARLKHIRTRFARVGDAWIVAGQTAAVLATAEQDSPDDAVRIAGLAHDPLMGAVLLIAVKSRTGGS